MMVGNASTNLRHALSAANRIGAYTKARPTIQRSGTADPMVAVHPDKRDAVRFAPLREGLPLRLRPEALVVGADSEVADCPSWVFH